MSLGGSIFIRNMVKFDYCAEAAIDSLLLFCDEVSIVECSSEDNTAEILDDKYGNLRKVKLELGHEWEVAHNFERLTILANYAKSKLTTKHHFMLQADEVVHESSIPYIHQALKSGASHAYMTRRYNLWGTPDHYIDFSSPHKPCSDAICRLANTDINAYGDAESLMNGGACIDYMDKIKIMHYGFIRNSIADKIIDMQNWFFAESKDKPATPDSRAFKHKEDGYFDPAMKNEDGSFSYGQSAYLKRLPFDHPETAKKWVEGRRNDKDYKWMEV